MLYSNGSSPARRILRSYCFTTAALQSAEVRQCRAGAIRVIASFAIDSNNSISSLQLLTGNCACCHQVVVVAFSIAAHLLPFLWT
jgi:hypothetical protein